MPDAVFESFRDWSGHVIVCGVQQVAGLAAGELRLAGAQVVIVADYEADESSLLTLQRNGARVVPRTSDLGYSLQEAGIEGASAVICAEGNDLQTLETVLLVADVRPDVRVVAQLDNPAVAHAVQETSHTASVIDVAALFSPPVVEVCMRHRAHNVDVGGFRFVSLETVAPSAATLRELYGSLVPLGVVTPGRREPIVCPGRDTPINAGDRVTVLGTPDELAAVGLQPHSAIRAEVKAVRLRGLDAIRRLRSSLSNLDRALRIALSLGLALLVVSTLILHLFYERRGGLSFVSSAYFTVETVATVGFGDFSFANQPLPMELFGILLIVAGTTLVTTIFALVTNALVSRRIAQSLGQARIPGMRGHVVLIGLGSVGMAVLDGLLERGQEVVVVERDESNRFLNQVRQRGVPMVLGDSTLAQTLDSVNLVNATSVAIVTSNDLANIETALAVRDRLGDRWLDVPVVVRVFDRHLGARLEGSFGFQQVWSTAAIAAPWFVGAALGLDVLSSFYVGSHPFLLARLVVSDGGGLEGLAMQEIDAAVRVIAINRAGGDGRLEHPPRRGTRLMAGDEAYMAGPYEGLLQVLRRERDRGARSRAGSTD